MISATGNIMRLIDHDNIPPGIFQVGAVFNIAFDRIYGHDGFIVIMKRVVICRHISPNSLYGRGIQTDQRDREALPHFLLELIHHAFYSDYKDSLSLAAGNQLAHENACLKRFAQADSICD